VRLADELATLRREIDVASVGGDQVPLIVSECNVSTAANFLKTTDTLDTRPTTPRSVPLARRM
jgi:hypothetical protein